MARSRDAEQALISGRPLLGLPYRYWALVLACLGFLFNTVEVSAVTVALPVLSDEFGSSTDDVLWLALVFALVTVGWSLNAGRFGDLYGHRRLFAGGLLLSAVGGGLAAAAGSLGELLAARVVIALGLATVAALTPAIVTAVFPASQRRFAIGLMMGSVGVGLATGPVLGGVILETLDWRALFWLRAPFGVLTAVAAWFILRDRPALERPHGADLPGAVLLFIFLFLLVLGVNRGNAWGWGSAAVIGAFATGVALAGAFVWWERRAPSPVVALPMLAVRPFAMAVLAQTLQFAGNFGVWVLMPFFLLQARGFSILETGGLVAALPIGMALTGPIAGRLGGRFSARMLATAGLLIMLGGEVWLLTMPLEASVPGLVLRLSVIGVGSGVFQTSNIAAMVQSIPAERVGTAAAFDATTRTVGQSVGLAISGALFSAQAAAYAEARSPRGLDDPLVAPAALLDGLQLAFLVSVGILAAAVVASWLRGAPAGHR